MARACKKHNVGSVILAVAVLLMGSAGCQRSGWLSGWRQRPADPDATHVDAGDLDPSDTGPDAEPTPQPLNLAALEEFLRKTEHYAEASPQPQALTGSTTPDPQLQLGPGGAGLAAPANGVVANAQVDLTPRSNPATASPVLAVPVVRSVTIRTPAPAQPAAGAEPAAQTATNTPLQARTPVQQAAADEFVALLADAATAQPSVETEWQLRLAQLATGRFDEARQVPNELAPRQQQLLQRLVEVGIATRSALRDPLLGADAALQQAEQLRASLAQLADPIISTVAFCKSVVNFGVYEEMSQDLFVAGQSIITIVYCEIRNLRAETTEDGQHCYRLGTRLEVLNAEGQSMWKQEEPEIEDRCRVPRTDFFVAQRITLPPTLPPGEYYLRVLVEDHHSGRAHETTHPFTIAAPMSIAQGE